MFCLFHSLPQEDSDFERERSPPTPPPARKLSRRGHSFKLACIGKQESDENPLVRKVGQPLRLTQSQVNQVYHHLSAFLMLHEPPHSSPSTSTHLLASVQLVFSVSVHNVSETGCQCFWF